MSFKDGGKKVKSKINYKLLSERGLEENKVLLAQNDMTWRLLSDKAKEVELMKAIIAGLKAELELLNRK